MALLGVHGDKSQTAGDQNQAIIFAAPGVDPAQTGNRTLTTTWSVLGPPYHQPFTISKVSDLNGSNADKCISYPAYQTI